MVVDCTMNALPAIKWIMVLGGFLAMILGLFGMQFFGGKLWSCQFPPGVVDAFGGFSDEPTCLANAGTYGDRTLTACENAAASVEFGEPFTSAVVPVTLTECAMPTIVTKTQCEQFNGTWANTEYNFDNIGQALVVVFITSTADNWQDTMYTGIDSVAVGKNLVYDYNLWNCLYYVVVTMLSCFFWANMFVSTLVDQYTKASEKEGVLAMADVGKNAALTQALLLTKQQQKRREHWVDRQAHDRFTKTCIATASNPWFGRTMMGVIVLNGFALMCLHADQPGWLDDTDYISGIIFQILYCGEVVILLTAMTPVVYWEDPWNRFDIFIVVAGTIELCVPGDAPWVAVLRTFRIMRLFKIVKGMNELRILMYTIISALPGVSNIGVLLFLLMFMYACLGVTLYGDVDAPYGFPDGLNKHANFKTWPNAMFTLFVVFTGNWESIFRATYWNCAGDALDWGRECTHRYSAPFYFFSYYIFANCVLGNLFVSIILDKFTAETTADSDADTDLVEVVQIAHMLSVFRSMMTQKIRIYQMLTGRLPRKQFMEAEHVYGRFLTEWDGEVMEHDEATAIVANLKNMRALMMATYNGDASGTWAGLGSPGVHQRNGGKLTVSTSAKAYSLIAKSDVDTAHGGYAKKSKRDGSHESDKSGRSASRTKSRPKGDRTDPERDDAKQRRRKERDARDETHDRDRDTHTRLPPILDDDSDSFDGDDFMSEGGSTPGPGPRDPSGKRRGSAQNNDPQNWLSGCSFIPGLDYCAAAPPPARRDRKRRDQGE